jgi:hypothetical protein
MTDEQQLLPCPFCGAPAEVEKMGDDSEAISCSDAECCATVLCCDAEQWNRRTPPAAKP